MGTGLWGNSLLNSVRTELQFCLNCRRDLRHPDGHMFCICAGKERYSDYGHRFCMSRFALRNANEYSPMQIPASRAAPILAHRHHRCWPSHQIKRHVSLDVSVPSRILSVAHYISWNRGETLVLRDWPAIRKRKDSLGVHPDPGEALRELIAQKPRDSPALQTPQSVFFHRGWNCHVDFINPPQRFFVENQSVSAEAFVQIRDGGGSDDG